MATTPTTPTGRVQLRPLPPSTPHEGIAGLLMNALPLLGSLGSVGLVVTMGGGSGGRAYLVAGLFLASTLGFVVVQVERQRTLRGHRVEDARAGYLHHLADVRARARDAAARQRHALLWHHPEPAALPALAAERSRLWRRTGADPEFLHVRYAVGERPSALELATDPDDDPDRADPVAAAAQERLLAVHGTQVDLPLVLDLGSVAHLELCGPPDAVRCLVRAVLCAAVASHSPGYVVVAVLCAGPARAEWEWVKWLPHARSDRSSDALGRRRMIGTVPDELAALVPPGVAERARAGGTGRAAGPHLLLVVDGVPLPSAHALLPRDGLSGMTVVQPEAPEAGPPGPGTARLRLEEEPAVDGRHPVCLLRPGEEPARGRADRCGAVTAEALARRLAPLHDDTAGRAASGVGGLHDGPDAEELLGLGDVRTLDPATAWRPRPVRDRLRVPIGVDAGGEPVHLDLKEAAQQGMGPHGLVVGATGSGKSELLRTLVLGLAASHSPEALNLVLVDFKGGATFAGMATLPHVSALITNLEQDLTLVDRMQDALAGELVRRQALLRAAGNLTSVRDHDRTRRAGAALPAMPSLLVVVDEFSELLSARPEFLRLFEAIGRLGRSLGVHLLLASQRLDESRLQGLEAHLSYRIGLRTFSASESRAALGVPDAHTLPAVPGAGLLRTDSSTLVRFTVGHVSGPATVHHRSRREPDERAARILPFTAAAVPGPRASEPAPATVEGPSLLDVAVARLAGHGPPAHPVWLPPLDAPDPLDALMDDLAVDPRLGLLSRRWHDLPGLVVPLGTVDRPREQRRDPLCVDLSGAGGHVAVVGGPRSGKTTLLRTLVASLALTATPAEVQVFVLDLGGGGLSVLAGLPHVAGVASRAQPDVVRRVLAEVRGVLDRREASFPAAGIDSVETWRARRAAGRRRTPEDATGDGYGDVFVVVDGWGTLRTEHEEVEAELQRLAGRALALGVHLVAATGRWADFRTATRELFATRLELRLGDASDSEIDRRAAARVPIGRPGRGLVTGGWHVLAALPRIDGRAEVSTLASGLDDLVRRVASAWPGPPAPRLRLLPRRVDLAAVRALAAAGAADRGLLLGLDEDRLAPRALDPDREPHLLVLGEGGSGRSAALRTYVREVVRLHTPQEATVVLVDPRHSLLGEVPPAYLHDHLRTAARAGPALADLAATLERRLPGPDVTPAQLRRRSWWVGPEVFVVVDDHDLLTTGRGSPVEVLVPLLAQARDVGMHLAVARRTGGASRAWHEPVLQALRDLAAPGLLLAGSPDEGPLLGGLRPGAAPPGRGRLLTRDRGVEVLQVAWCDPTP